MIKYVKHFFKTVYAIFYYAITALIPKDNQLWVFGAWKGTSYSDNTKYLYEYVLENCKDIKAVWLTKDEKIYRYLLNQNKPVVFYPSREAKRIIARARFLFQTEGNRDTGVYQVGGTTVIQLFHGIPAKHLNWYNKYSAIKQKIIKIESGDHGKSVWASASPFYERAFREILKLPSDCVFINTGLPRCDIAYMSKASQLVETLKRKYRNIVLYLPTHRNFGDDFDSKFISDGLNTVDQCLKNTDTCFLFKPHPNEVELFRKSKEHFSNVVVLDGKDQESQDVYSYLFQCDALVSDYSSIIYDYLCVNKPIVLFDYDLDYYINEDAGLFEDYFSQPVGPICYDWEEMVQSIKDQLQEDCWFEKREKAFQYFNIYSDGNSSKKITDYCLGKIDLQYAVPGERL